MSPRGESSAPTINPFELGRQLGELTATLERIEARLAALPCAAHGERMERLSAEVHQRSWPAWLRDWRLVLPFVALALGLPQVRACVGEERARVVEAAVKKLESAPPQPKVLVTPMPVPVPMPDR